MSNVLLSVQRILDKKSLNIVGYFNPNGSDNVCSKVRTILLIGPKELYFWDVFKKSREYKDNKENPLDRWSKKTIEEIAIKFDARSFFLLKHLISHLLLGQKNVRRWDHPQFAF